MCLPEFIEDMVSQDNPVRVIDSFVDSLDMHKLGFVKAQSAGTGRPAYDPRDLLKLYLYGYFNKIRFTARNYPQWTVPSSVPSMAINECTIRKS